MITIVIVIVVFITAGVLISGKFRKYPGLNSEEKAIIHAALEGCDKQSIAYDFLAFDEEENCYSICFFINGTTSIDTCNKVRENINTYLIKHPEDIFHKSFIQLIFKDKNPDQYAYMECSNFDPAVRNSQEPAQMYAGLYFISYLHFDPDLMKMSCFKNYTDILGFEGNEQFIIDDITVMDQMKNLEIVYFHNLTKNQKAYLKKTHPGIQIEKYIS